MVITIHQTRKRINFVNRSERGLSFKWRQGCKPNKLEQSITIEGLPEIVNKKFKRVLTDKLLSENNHMRHDVLCQVVTPYGVFESHSRSPEVWANNLANCILRQIKEHKHSYSASLEAWEAKS